MEEAIGLLHFRARSDREPWVEGLRVPATVDSVNDDPVAVNDSDTTNEDTPVTIPVHR